MKLFKKSKELFSPLEGDYVAIKDIPDQVFSEKMMGDGFAINPKSGQVYSPIDGEVVLVFDTGHAIGLKTKDNIEILIHFGIDTVKLNGEGFDVKVKEGMKVKKGDILMNVDLEDIRDKVPSLITPIIITSGQGFELDFKKSYSVGEKVLTFVG